MILSELLSHTRVNVLRDTRTPPLFSNSVVVGFLNEGQQRAATRTHSFLSATREISLSSGENTYALDDDIVFVYSVRLDGYPHRLSVSTEFWTPDDETNTLPIRYTVDRETQTIRFYPTPDQDYTAILRVARLPETLSVDDLSAEIELKAQYQLSLADWAAYRCLSLNDVDGENNEAALLAKKRFDETISEIKHDEYRLKMSSNDHARGRRVK